jgi:hypothetical protein
VTVSVIVGNGNSRKNLNASLLNDKYTFACNYAYRDFQPKNLIICDRPLLITALSEGAVSKAKVWTRQRWYNNINPKKNLHPLPDLCFEVNQKFDKDINWGSGTYAAYLACLDEPSVLVFVGFDLWDTKGKINNVYAGQNGYGPIDSGPVSPVAWIHQFKTMFSYFEEKQFVFLNEKGWQAPKEWDGCQNCFVDNIREFKKL